MDGATRREAGRDPSRWRERGAVMSLFVSSDSIMRGDFVQFKRAMFRLDRFRLVNLSTLRIMQHCVQPPSSKKNIVSSCHPLRSSKPAISRSFGAILSRALRRGPSTQAEKKVQDFPPKSGSCRRVGSTIHLRPRDSGETQTKNLQPKSRWGEALHCTGRDFTAVVPPVLCRDHTPYNTGGYTAQCRRGDRDGQFRPRSTRIQVQRIRFPPAHGSTFLLSGSMLKGVDHPVIETRGSSTIGVNLTLSDAIRPDRGRRPRHRGTGPNHARSKRLGTSVQGRIRLGTGISQRR